MLKLQITVTKSTDLIKKKCWDAVKNETGYLMTTILGSTICDDYRVV